jgi:hypothetical protein
MYSIGRGERANTGVMLEQMFYRVLHQNISSGICRQ